jgi:hypothetical protein
MTLLLQQFAPGRRDKLGALWKNERVRLLEEYEYEYGNAHLPYAQPNAKANAGPRTELLHPLFVRRDLPASLKIGQLTDIHVDVRADVYEENLLRETAALRDKLKAKFNRWTSASYNNWNRNFVSRTRRRGSSRTSCCSPATSWTTGAGTGAPTSAAPSVRTGCITSTGTGSSSTTCSRRATGTRSRSTRSSATTTGG